MDMLDHEAFSPGENIIIFLIDWHTFWALRDGTTGTVMFSKIVNRVRV